MSSSPAAASDPDGRVYVNYYDPGQLRRGDVVFCDSRSFVIDAPAGTTSWYVRDLERPRLTRTVNFTQLGASRAVSVSRGRLSGLREAFWTDGAVGRISPHPPAGPEHHPLSEIPLTVGGGLQLRVAAGGEPSWLEQLGRKLWLGVPGFDMWIGHRFARRPLLWSRLGFNLEVAGRLDGGLTAAGNVLRHAAAGPFNSADSTWVRLVQAHFGLDPDVPAGPGHTLIASLAPTWTHSLEQLAAVLAGSEIVVPATRPGAVLAMNNQD